MDNALASKENWPYIPIAERATMNDIKPIYDRFWLDWEEAQEKVPIENRRFLSFADCLKEKLRHKDAMIISKINNDELAKDELRLHMIVI